eukprot:gene17558-12566_t
MSIINVAAAKGYVLSAYDIKSAFLMTPIEPGKTILIKLTRQLAKLWITVCPDQAKFLNPDGHLVLKLGKYLYGLAESPRMFNRHLHSTLEREGFCRSPVDPCLYTKISSKGVHAISVHVDDVLSSAPDTEHKQHIEHILGKHFDITKQEGSRLSYLGMNIESVEDHITVDQLGYLESILGKWMPAGARPASTPSVNGIMEVRKEDQLSQTDASRYLSLIMSLMYLARFTRPDILFPLSILATRTTAPSATDLQHAFRIVTYLNGTKDLKLHFPRKTQLVPAIYADASHCVHPTGHGHGGIILTLGTAPVICRSFKLKMITRSSSESELVCLEEATTRSGLQIDLVALGDGTELAIDPKPIANEERLSSCTTQPSSLSTVVYVHPIVIQHALERVLGVQPLSKAAVRTYMSLHDASHWVVAIGAAETMRHSHHHHSSSTFDPLQRQYYRLGISEHVRPFGVVVPALAQATLQLRDYDDVRLRIFTSVRSMRPLSITLQPIHVPATAGHGTTTTFDGRMMHALREEEVLRYLRESCPAPAATSATTATTTTTNPVVAALIAKLDETHHDDARPLLLFDTSIVTLSVRVPSNGAVAVAVASTSSAQETTAVEGSGGSLSRQY